MIIHNQTLSLGRKENVGQDVGSLVVQAFLALSSSFFISLNMYLLICLSFTPIYIFSMQVENIFAHEEKYDLLDNKDLEVVNENSVHHTRKVRNADISELCKPISDESFHSQVVSLLSFSKEKNNSPRLTKLSYFMLHCFFI